MSDFVGTGRLGGKVALVTGAGAGIGKTIAETFAAEGATVCIADINQSAAESVAHALNEMGATALGLKMDVTNETEVNAVVAQIVQEHGSIDILVANAGIQHLDEIADVSFADWKRVLSVHLDGSFLTTQACLKQRHAWREHYSARVRAFLFGL